MGLPTLAQSVCLTVVASRILALATIFNLSAFDAVLRDLIHDEDGWVETI